MLIKALLGNAATSVAANTHLIFPVYVLRGDVIAVRCAPDGFESPDDDVRSVSIEWFDERRRSIAKRKQSRVTIDDKLNLAVSGTQPEDAGHYTCTMTVILGTASTIELHHRVHLNGIPQNNRLVEWHSY
jgi:Immunoglobulin I-set domain